MRPGWSVSSVPNCSAIVRGAWFGSMMPPAPSRIDRVCAATWAISTLVAAEAMVAMLWCSAYQIRRYPHASADRASSTLAAKRSAMLSSAPRSARSRIDRGTDTETSDGHGEAGEPRRTGLCRQRRDGPRYSYPVRDGAATGPGLGLTP
jgi:hypothetical protein